MVTTFGFIYVAVIPPSLFQDKRPIKLRFTSLQWASFIPAYAFELSSNYSWIWSSVWLSFSFLLEFNLFRWCGLARAAFMSAMFPSCRFLLSFSILRTKIRNFYKLAKVPIIVLFVHITCS